ncbi:MAG: IclR family transcriptional regulator, acetate operon repressor [Solirubrobacteraceae bacterium]|jgi:DNA-binding IclR family transcriptional regulator|nr:IclR family transcriptional regulator, acetate operon repressor [Solirubrobacteraceae bacterium]
MSAEASARPDPDPTAERAAHVLAAVLERSPRTVTELAEVVGLPAVDVAPLVAGLQSHDLVAWDAEGVRPGTAALRFARSGVGREDLVELAQPSMRRLATESGETANLILPRPAGTEAIAQIDGRHLLGATNWIGRELGLHSTAAGKVFLAFGAVELPAGELEALTPATVTDRERLRRELEAVRDQGYATIVDELEPGLSAVAAPVRDRGGAVIAALTASGASLRLAPQRLRLLGRVCLEQAHALSTRLGHDAPLDEYLATKSQGHANTTVPLP